MSAIKRPCLKCGALVDRMSGSSYCEVCGPDSGRPRRSYPGRGDRPNGAKRAQLRKVVITRDGGICHRCGLPGANTMDHYPIPRVAGGPDELWNLRAAHARCNSAAGARGAAEARRLKRQAGWGA